MRSRPVLILVVVQVCFALALVVVADYGVMRDRQIGGLRSDLQATRAELHTAQADLDRAEAAAAAADARAAAAEARAGRLQARVDALEAALRRQGVDPGTVVVEVTRGSSQNRAAPSPAPQASSSPRPRPPSPSPRPSPSASPTCVRLPVVGCR